MSRWLAVAVIAVLLGIVLIFVLRPEAKHAAPGDEEARIVAYLKDHVRPGQPVLVTELYNNVFTTTEERAALERLYDVFFRIPAFAVQTQRDTGKIPTLKEISEHFNLKIPGEVDVMLRIMETDPRMPQFFERDKTTGEIKSIDVDRIVAHERFGQPLRNR